MSRWALSIGMSMGALLLVVGCGNLDLAGLIADVQAALDGASFDVNVNVNDNVGGDGSGDGTSGDGVNANGSGDSMNDNAGE